MFGIGIPEFLVLVLLIAVLATGAMVLARMNRP